MSNPTKSNKTIGLWNDEVSMENIYSNSNNSWPIMNQNNQIITSNASNPPPTITVYSTLTNPTPSQSTTVTIERERYKSEEDPMFADGEIVEVDLSYFNIFKEKGKQNIVEGVIIGKIDFGSISILSRYIVDFGDKIFGDTYPYRSMVVPMHAFVKPEAMPWEK